MRKANSSEGPLADFFLELASTPSPSGQERDVVDLITARLEAMGLDVSEEDPPVEGEAGNLYCHLAGNTSGIPVLFSAHTDTVKSAPGVLPAPVIKEGVIRSGSRAVLGADDKAALAAIIIALERIVEQGISHAGIELLLTVGEENGLKGAKACKIDGLRARCGFCFDSTGPVGEVIVRSPSQKTIRATFKGKAAHAGVEPEMGRSAVKAAAGAIAAMKLGRIDDVTTANIGIIRGGEAVNVVPDRCTIEGESRSHEPASLDQQITGMIDAINIAAASAEVDVEVSVIDEFQAFDLGTGNLPVELASRALRRLGIAPVLATTGGGSDVNEFNRKGLESVNLSVGMEKVHTPDEYITLQSLDQACDLVIAIIAEAAT